LVTISFSWSHNSLPKPELTYALICGCLHWRSKSSRGETAMMTDQQKHEIEGSSD